MSKKTKMNKGLITTIVVLACSALILFAWKFLLPQEEIALDQTNKIIVVKGDVKIKKSSPGAAWQKMDVSTILEKGDMVETAQGASVDIIIGKNTDKAIKLEENSSVEFQKVNPGYLNFSKGKMLVALKKLEPKSSFIVKTPTAICGARGTGWVEEAGVNKTTIRVFDSEVFVRELNMAGEPKMGKYIAREGMQVILMKDRPMSAPQKIGEEDLRDWQYWTKGVSYLREGKLLINDFNKKENFNNIGGPFGSWNVFYSDTNQYCKDEFTPLETTDGKGFSLKVSYDVDARFSAYNGFFTNLMGIDISEYKYLVFYVKGDKQARYTTKLNIELKNKIQTGRISIEGVTDEWKKITLPLSHFVGMNSFKEMKEMVIVFSDMNVTKKVGVIYLDDIYFALNE